MSPDIARVLLKNLIARLQIRDDGARSLPGVVTDDELASLHIAAKNLGAAPAGLTFTEEPLVEVSSVGSRTGSVDCSADTESTKSGQEKSQDVALTETIVLVGEVLNMPTPPSNVRICLDFGTAMSKATLVADEDDGCEEISVLELGRPGNQEEISLTMLVSSVYIDNQGRLWFGKTADDMSKIEEGEGARQRLDNIKRRLSEDGFNEPLGARLNPTELSATYREMILAYLTFFTWTVNQCTDALGYPRNTSRRYAMPCLSGQKGREVKHELFLLIGQAQVLADTFSDSLTSGLPLQKFLAAAHEARKLPPLFPYVLGALTEPLGVASSLLNWKSKADMLAMVIDVGAGTSDLSLYRIAVNPAQGTNAAIEAEGAARGITEAGNYLDRILIELILKKSGVTASHPRMLPIRGRLELSIRDMKETLFNEGTVFIPVDDALEVEIDLEEFRKLEAVRKFGESLEGAMKSILEEVDESFVDWAATHPERYLTVVLTGGGANLPMVKELASGEIRVGDKLVRLVQALSFPTWLQEAHPDLEESYPRVAVSLGGARHKIIRSEGSARVTAGGNGAPMQLGGYYVTGA